MTRARILADYVAGGTTAAEFDYLDGLTSTAVGINDTQTLANKTLASTTTFPAGIIRLIDNKEIMSARRGLPGAWRCSPRAGFVRPRCSASSAYR